MPRKATCNIFCCPSIATQFSIFRFMFSMKSPLLSNSIELAWSQRRHLTTHTSEDLYFLHQPQQTQVKTGFRDSVIQSSKSTTCKNAVHNQLEISYVTQFKSNFRLEPGLKENIIERFSCTQTQWSVIYFSMHKKIAYRENNI